MPPCDEDPECNVEAAESRRHEPGPQARRGDQRRRAEPAGPPSPHPPPHPAAAPPRPRPKQGARARRPAAAPPPPPGTRRERAGALHGGADELQVIERAIVEGPRGGHGGKATR